MVFSQSLGPLAGRTTRTQGSAQKEGYGTASNGVSLLVLQVLFYSRMYYRFLRYFDGLCSALQRNFERAKLRSNKRLSELSARVNLVLRDQEVAGSNPVAPIAAFRLWRLGSMDSSAKLPDDATSDRVKI
jgi:hypothetical protein